MKSRSQQPEWKHKKKVITQENPGYPFPTPLYSRVSNPETTAWPDMNGGEEETETDTLVRRQQWAERLSFLDLQNTKGSVSMKIVFFSFVNSAVLFIDIWTEFISLLHSKQVTNSYSSEYDRLQIL